jgi:hypothetical protein
MQRISMTVIASAVFILAGCMLFENQGAARPDRPAASKEAEPQQADTIELQGTVVKNDLEGGFFAIEGVDGKTYEPINLPDAFRKDGMRVKATVRVRRDVRSIHMVGEIVEIVDIAAQ